MKPAPFAFVRPQGLQHALEALAADPGAKVLAGGQSLVPLLSMRLAAPSTLVDINGLPDLDQVRVDATGVHVGALARHADVLASPGVRRAQPLLTLALGHVAHATIRNRGTVVGSLVHADAAAELPAVLCVLGGRLTAVSVDGSRVVPAEALYAGPLESTVRHDEIAVEAFFPALAPGEGVAFEELSRRHGDYALCGVAAVVRVSGGDVVAARAGYLSVADVPTVVDLGPPLVEEVVRRTSRDDQGPSPAALEAAGDLALRSLAPADDLHATAGYRAHLVRVLTARALGAAYHDARSREAGRA